jgi:acyl-homoserine lactone acylase PvdQ
MQPSRSSEKVPTVLVTCQAQFDGPVKLYEAHLSSDSGTDVYGATFPGLPAMYVGCNCDIAWGFTPNAPDVADTLMFRLRSLSPLLYTYMDRPFACWVEPTRFGIGDSPAGSGQIVPRELAYSHAGPVVSIAEMTAEVLTMAGWRDINGLEQWLRVNRARSVSDFRTALAKMQVPSLNAVCADRQGRIFYAYCAKSSRKSDQIDWRFPVDGNHIETEWMGWLPFDKLPQISDPPTGFVQSGNGVPWRTAGQSLLDPTDFPPYLVEDLESIRTDRILEIMQARQVLSLDSAKDIAWDTVVPFAYNAVQMIAAAHSSEWREYEDARGSMLLAVQMLQKWDRRVTPDSKEAMLFATWWREYRAKFPQMPDVGVVRALTKPGRQQVAASMPALKRAVGFMTERYGRLDVPWGEVRRFRYEQHEFPVGGSAALHTVHQTAPEPGPSWAVEFAGSGDVYKMVVQLRETPDVYSVTPFGNASAPASPHVADQMELYSNQQLKFVDLAGSIRGRDVESAWGTRARFELEGGNSEFELSVPMPVTAQVSILEPTVVMPPLPRSARSVGSVVQLGTVPYSEGCQWTLTTRAPEDVIALRDEGYVPVGVIESLPNQWIPLPAQWRDDGAALVVEGRGQGAIALYLVPPQEKPPNALEAQ